MQDQPPSNILEVKNSIQDRIAGTVFGAACGSSLGGSCIGLRHKDILVAVGISRLRDFEPGLSKSYLPNHKAGALLADAMAAFALADSLISKQGRLDFQDLKLRYLNLLEDPKFANSAARVPCLAALRHTVDNIESHDDHLEAAHSSSAIRAFITGCLPGNNLSDDPISVAIKQAQLGHTDPVIAAGSAVIADSIRFCIDGNRLDNNEQVKQYVMREYKLAQQIAPKFAEAWDGVAPDLDYSKPAEELPYSLVNVGSEACELIPTSVGIFLIFRHSAEEAICAASRCGGDTDIVATIVGALAGAYHGMSSLPKRWIEKISDKDRLEKIANGLYELWT